MQRSTEMWQKQALMCFYYTHHSNTPPERGYILDKRMHVEHFNFSHAPPLKQKKFTHKWIF